MGEETKVYRVLVEKPEGKNHSEDREMEGWDKNGCLGDWLGGGGGWRGFSWLRKGTDGELLPSGSGATELITSSKSCVCVCVLFDAIRYSRDIYTEHIIGVRQQ
jgi:hypothetical protein